jgi:hypothetical protein
VFLINSRLASLAASALRRKALFRSYGRFFAEFLNNVSLVHLRLLASPTCVGLRYGCLGFNPRGFSWHQLQLDWVHLAVFPSANLGANDKRICLFVTPLASNVISQITPNLRQCVTPSENQGSAGILTSSSIDYAFRPRLRID